MKKIMKTEYEIRILEIDKEEIIKKLERLGAEFIKLLLKLIYQYYLDKFHQIEK